MKNKKTAAVLTLLFLAPFCGELLSTSAPPKEFFQPLSLILFFCLYGCGALLIRELTIRWQRGWGSIFILGLAYGIYEEGLVVRSFFDPNWGDLGLLAAYGRFGGVNWVWALALTLFHAVISISMPILLVGLIFPEIKDKQWLKKRGVIAAGVLFGLTLMFGPLVGMRINFINFMACVISIGVLGLCAYFSPNLPKTNHVKPAPGLWIFLVGFSMMIGLFLILWVFPSLGIPAWIPILMALILPIIYLIILILSGVSEWRARQQWWFAFGVLSIWILSSVQASFDPSRLDDPTGSAGTAMIFLVWFLWLGYRVKLKPQIA